MQYYKKPKPPIYQHPAVIIIAAALLLTIGALIGYFAAQNKKTTPTLTAQPHIPQTTNSAPTIASDTHTNDDTILTDDLQNPQTTTPPDTTSNETPTRIATESPPLSSDAKAVLQSQKNSPVTWELSQKDPTQNTTTTSTPTPQPTTITITPSVLANDSAPIGDTSVLHPEDIPANEHAQIRHLQNPNPPLIIPKTTPPLENTSENTPSQVSPELTIQ